MQVRKSARRCILMGNWFYNLRNRLSQFMYGRYGSDKLNIAVMIVWMACAFINVFIQSTIFYMALSIFPILIFYRMLSRNINKRYRENARFEGLLNKFTGKFRLQITKIKQFKTHRFFKCPACKATIRIPKRTGKVTVRCTKCGHQFDKKIWF